MQRNHSWQAPSHESKKKKVFNQCVLPAVTHRWQAWSLAKAVVVKLEVGQWTLEGRLLIVNVRDRVCGTIIRQRVRVMDGGWLRNQHEVEVGWTHGLSNGKQMDHWRHGVGDGACGVGWGTKTSLERWNCGATRNGIYKDSKGLTKLEDWWRATSFSGRT